MMYLEQFFERDHLRLILVAIGGYLELCMGVLERHRQGLIPWRGSDVKELEDEIFFMRKFINQNLRHDTWIEVNEKEWKMIYEAVSNQQCILTDEMNELVEIVLRVQRKIDNGEAGFEE